MSEIGMLLAIGRTAEVFEYGPGKVAKVLRPGFGEGLIAVEELACAALAATGATAVRTFGRIVHDGRPGLVMERFDGTDMLAALGRRPWRASRLAEDLAATHAEIHSAFSDDLPDARERLVAKIENTSGVLGFTEREAAKSRVRALGGGNRVLHGDLHPGNVLLAGDRVVPIDWSDATRGPIAPDIVRTLWLLSPPVIPDDMPKRRLVLLLVNRFRHRYQAEYERITGLDRRELAPWRLPVLAGRISEGIDHEEEALVAAVRALAR